MVFGYEWHSLHGPLTDENRDYCGIAQRRDAALYVVIDGATRGPHGGDLARELACHLVDGFLALDAPVTEQRVCDLLQQAHEALRRQYPADSASYLIAVKTDNGAYAALHAGDCRLGRVKKDQSIAWLSGVHTLANATADLSDAELASHPSRHILTRSFRPREFQQPERTQFDIDSNDILLIATDGFWAEMDAAMQAEFLEGRFPGPEQWQDDTSCLILRPGCGEAMARDDEPENIYRRSVRDAG